jgi:predicted nucleic acid-binding protein
MIYLDASVVFSLHFRDSNTAEALDLVRDATESLLISAFCELETINAFALRRFRHEISELNVSNAVKDLQKDLHSGFFHWKPIPETAFTRARVLSRKITPSIGVRAADLLHIAAALELGAKTFYTFDQRQHQAAQAAGLTVNQLPNPHP